MRPAPEVPLLPCQAAKLSREGVRVSYFSEENPLQEDLRRLARLHPTQATFACFTGPAWTLLTHLGGRPSGRPKGDAICFLDSWTDLWSATRRRTARSSSSTPTCSSPYRPRSDARPDPPHRPQKRSPTERERPPEGASAQGQKADVSWSSRRGRGHSRSSTANAASAVFDSRSCFQARTAKTAAQLRRSRPPGGTRRRAARREDGEGHPDVNERLAERQRTAYSGRRQPEEAGGCSGPPWVRQSGSSRGGKRSRQGQQAPRRRRFGVLAKAGDHLRQGRLFLGSGIEVGNYAPLWGWGVLTHFSTPPDQPCPWCRGVVGAHSEKHGTLLVRAAVSGEFSHLFLPPSPPTCPGKKSW